MKFLLRHVTPTKSDALVVPVMSLFSQWRCTHTSEPNKELQRAGLLRVGSAEKK